MPVIATVLGMLVLARRLAPPSVDPARYPPPPSSAATDVVVRVIDGDTVEGRELGRIRYIGVDTPELNASDPDVRAMAQEAAEANRRLVEGRTVRVALDVQHRDRYGRVLAYVWAGPVFANAWLVENGWARVMTVPPNVQYADLFVELEREARGRRRGLWR